MWRKEDWKIPLKTIFHAFSSVSHRIVWPNANRTRTLIFMIITFQKSIVTTAINNVIISRINGNMTALTTRRSFPIILANRGTFIAMVNANRTIILLRHVNPIWKMIVRCYSIKLSRRLIVIS